MPSKIRFGMVGGGPGAFIGAVHRKAAALDGEMELVAGAFSSDPNRSRQQGNELGLSEHRIYGSFYEMAEGESALPVDERIHFVSIVTPNHTHYEIAREFIDLGFHVVCDKPMTTTVEDAIKLRKIVKESGCVFALTHNYTGYPLIKEAREIVRSGKIGTVRKVLVEYVQGWLSTRLEIEGQKQAAWRTNPDLAGAGALGDIGSHAENLVRYITALELSALCADVSTLVPGREIDDDATVLMHYEGGARGVLVCSQVAVGEENGLGIRIYGSEGALEWHQEEPNTLMLIRNGAPANVLRAGQNYLSDIATHNTRLPPGHPEGFIEAFANIYRNAGRTIQARLEESDPRPYDLDFPTVEDGVRGVHFIDTALESGRKQAWVDAKFVS